MTEPVPAGPALTYIGTPDDSGVWLTTRVDRVAPADPRERAICRALLVHALRLLDEETTRQDLGIAQLIKPKDA
ncbi:MULTISPECIES: hypothetical protein [Streptomyces]|uniref:Uncharacterized protein n=2 Tax=Streptomyces TaxID=1883 RepID=A0A2U9P0B5_STRAS|nr:hypothetical protein [Streptomyces actuosus]AWT42595.1 hypothetical protein DMT42_09895 [Streptomyces actuosus]MBM4819807.1 hypothetical protein [Streptomyces actuosus]